MRPQQLIATKRDGRPLSSEQINAFIDGVCDGSWADYQISAMLMAMFLRGLDGFEQDELTRAMLYSGKVLDLSGIVYPKADKHSTGGVGDKTSLIIAPILAACGVAVPMISGRGLGHTGGTLDKLESIPGYNVTLSTSELHSIVEQCGFAMAGQSDEIAPADRKLYALRDATATVPYIPLIVASIMSKKLAEGIDALVLDVKTGSGAFMKTFDDAKRLAEAMVETGTNFEVRTEAVISDMNQPLGQFVGNSHEVYECITIMRDEATEAMKPTLELSVELAARVLQMCGVAANIESARLTALEAVSSGSALERFLRNVELQGGDANVCDRPESLLTPGLFEGEIKSQTGGFVSAIDTFSVGNALVAIGGGRTRAEDSIDPAVGYSSELKIGDAISAGATLGKVYARNEDQFNAISQRLLDSYTIAETSVRPPDLIREIISPK